MDLKFVGGGRDGHRWSDCRDDIDVVSALSLDHSTTLFYEGEQWGPGWERYAIDHEHGIARPIR